MLGIPEGASLSCRLGLYSRLVRVPSSYLDYGVRYARKFKESHYMFRESFGEREIMSTPQKIHLDRKVVSNESEKPRIGRIGQNPSI